MLEEKANFATFGRTQEDQKEHKLEKYSKFRPQNISL